MKLNCIDPINVGSRPAAAVRTTMLHSEIQEDKVRDNFTFHNQLQIKIRVAFDK